MGNSKHGAKVKELLVLLGPSQVARTTHEWSSGGVDADARRKDDNAMDHDLALQRFKHKRFSYRRNMYMRRVLLLLFRSLSLFVPTNRGGFLWITRRAEGPRR